jgi:septum formation protein
MNFSEGVNDMNNKRLILASSSPRRRELLSGLKLDFITHPSDDNEDVPYGTLPIEMVELLSLRKARSIMNKYETGIIIGSDTIVVLNDEVLGKPKDNTDAHAMLTKLQGNAHTVYTGVAIIDAESGEYKVSHNRTQVTIKALTGEKISRYIATGEPADKAGAYAIQGFGATIVEGIEGDYFTVVGLPVGLLTEMLESFGVHIY